MANRFGRLEFEPAQPPPDPPGGRHKLAPCQDSHSHSHSHQQIHLEPDHDQHYWLRMAVDERRSGRFEGALRYYSRALEVDKSAVPGWVGQARMLIAMEEYPEAELWSRKALELFKNNADLLAARAQALCRMGDLKNALATCDAAINQQGISAYPWFSRGELMLARKDQLHQYCFDKAVQLEDDWLVPLEVGAVYEHYGRYPQALGRTRQAVERAPDHAYCWYRQGVCERALGLTGAAERSFNRCLQLVPNHSDARRHLIDITSSRRPIRNFLRRLFRGT